MSRSSRDWKNSRSSGKDIDRRESWTCARLPGTFSCRSGDRWRTTMSEQGKRYTGGCLCGALRYEAEGEPKLAGYCYCADCRKASGSGFIPFMNFPKSAVRFGGKTLTFTSKAANGGDAVRNSCPVCGGLVFGGGIGKIAVVHDLRRLARRPVALPSDGGHLHP
jgi:hypothetical protein